MNFLERIARRLLEAGERLLGIEASELPEGVNPEDFPAIAPLPPRTRPRARRRAQRRRRESLSTPLTPAEQRELQSLRTQQIARESIAQAPTRREQARETELQREARRSGSVVPEWVRGNPDQIQPQYERVCYPSLELANASFDDLRATGVPVSAMAIAYDPAADKWCLYVGPS